MIFKRNLMVKNFFLSILLAIFTVACSSTPPVDTQNKRVFVAEMAVNGVLTQLNVMLDEGRISPKDFPKVLDALDRLEQASFALKVAQQTGDFSKNPIQAVYSAINLLRPFIKERGNESNPNRSGSSSSFDRVPTENYRNIATSCGREPGYF